MSVPQATQIHPAVVAAPSVQCVGGPCDGQTAKNPIGRNLYVINAVDGLRTVSLPATAEYLKMAKDLGGYAGHYECGDDVLNWVAP